MKPFCNMSCDGWNKEILGFGDLENGKGKDRLQVEGCRLHVKG
jgi:hypothetical protein